MQTLLKEKVNVWAVFRSFRDASEEQGSGWEHKRIEPRAVKRPKGEVLQVEQVRRSYAQRKGDATLVHFVIQTKEERFFHLVYDAARMIWLLLYEFDDQLLFDEMEVDVEITWSGLTGSKK